MQLHFNTCADELDLSICHQNSSDQCKGGGTSRPPPPPERITTCRVGAGNSRVSVTNSDLMMISSASRENSATAAASPLGSWSNPSADLNDSLHLPVNRHDDSSFSSRQPRMIFSSANGAAADHERSGWSPRCYACSFCGREFNSAQALGGHMNIHRRDRARLRTSTSPASGPHDQADLPSSLQGALQYSPPTSILYDSFNEAALRESPISSLNVTYTPPTFNLLDLRPAAPDPTLLALGPNYPPRDENLPAPFSAPLVDKATFNGSTLRPSSAASVSRAQSEAPSIFSNIAPHASLFARARVENSALKHEESLHMSGGQGRPNCEVARSRSQLIQLDSQSKGRAKRARLADEAVDGTTAKSTEERSCREVERPNSEHVGRLLERPSKGVLCLDLELRLGQSCVDGADDCCRPSTWTRATTEPAPRPPA